VCQEQNKGKQKDDKKRLKEPFKMICIKYVKKKNQ